jgi:hypothetical protein
VGYGQVKSDGRPVIGNETADRLKAGITPPETIAPYQPPAALRMEVRTENSELGEEETISSHF